MENSGKFLVVYLIVLLAGCASAPAKNQFSVQHPVELEKAGVTRIATFGFILPKDLIVEKPSGNTCQWPIIGDNSGTLIEGIAYFVGYDNYANELVTARVENASASQVNSGRFVLLDRAGRRAFDFITGKYGEVDQKKLRSDSGYRISIMSKFGHSPTELGAYWQSYAKKFWVKADGASGVDEIQVGSPSWDEYKKEMEFSFPEMYKLGNGEIRIGAMGYDDYSREAARNPGITWWQRFRRDLKIGIPLVPEPISAGLGVAVPAAFAAYGATANKDPNGYYLDAQVSRKEVSDQMNEVKSTAQASVAENAKKVRYYELVIGTLVESGYVSKENLAKTMKAVGKHLEENYR